MPVVTTHPSYLSRAFAAAFQELQADGDAYARLCQQFLGQRPVHQPPSSPAEWPPYQDGTPLDVALRCGVLKVGYCLRPPHHLVDADGQHSGFDHELAMELARRISLHHGVAEMTVSWVELPEQEDHLSAFIAGMKKGDFVAAMAGPLYLEESNKEIEEALGVGETSIITLVGGYLTSELSQVLSAALHDVAQQPGRYADLYQKYLGVRREAPDLPTPSRFIPASEATSGSNLHRVLQSGELRLGFWRHEPYFYSKDGQDCGFELELVEAIGESLRKHYPGLQIRWVECPFESDGRGLENLLLYEALEPTLLKGEVDALLTGIIRMPDRPVAVAAPTIAFFWTVLYTGKDGWDLSSWQGGERQQLIDHLVSHPGCIVMSTPGGPSQETAERLVRDTLDAGGSASSVVATVPEMIQAAFSQSVHFITGDAVALANLAMHPDFQGLNMNISARLYEMLWLSPVTALDP